MTDESQRVQRDLFASRRCVLLGAGVLGAAGVLSACSTTAIPYNANDAGQAPGTATPAAADTPTAAAASGTAGTGQPGTGQPGTGQPGTGQPGTLLGEAAAVPVGGGMIYTSAKVVVTQPTAGEYKAFSAVCTHAGCIVDGVANGVIQCPCHGSQFNITTGAVVTGPASSPLPAKTVTVTDGKLVVSS